MKKRQAHLDRGNVQCLHAIYVASVFVTKASWQFKGLQKEDLHD